MKKALVKEFAIQYVDVVLKDEVKVAHSTDIWDCERLIEEVRAAL